MNCPRCQTELKKEWRYCPSCGFSGRRSRSSFFDLDFSDIFGEMEKMQRQMHNQMKNISERNVDVVDLTPHFKKGGRGFTIKITQKNHNKPAVEVNTFGDVNKQEIEREVGKELGIPFQKPAKKEHPPSQVATRFAKAKEHEEPPAEVTESGDNVIVKIHLKGVKSEKDIDINELESSVEIKAIGKSGLTGSKAYFKILTKPEEFGLRHKTFEKEILTLEFS